jgi:cyclase
LTIPVVASGGAGTPKHLIDVFGKANADAALVASMVHFGGYTVPMIKDDLSTAGIPVRMDGIVR